MFSLHNCLIGTIPGSVGETSVVAILIGAVILLATGIGSWRIMASFHNWLVMGAIFNGIALNDFMGLSPIHQIAMGGFMFGMVFMSTDPVTAASTNKGKLIYGFFESILNHD